MASYSLSSSTTLILHSKAAIPSEPFTYNTNDAFSAPQSTGPLVPPPPVMGGPMTKSWEDAGNLHFKSTTFSSILTLMMALIEKLDKNLPKRYGVKLNRRSIEKTFLKKAKYQCRLLCYYHPKEQLN